MQRCGIQHVTVVRGSRNVTVTALSVCMRSKARRRCTKRQDRLGRGLASTALYACSRAVLFCERFHSSILSGGLTVNITNTHAPERIQDGPSSSPSRFNDASSLSPFSHTTRSRENLASSGSTVFQNNWGTTEHTIQECSS